MNEDYIKVVVTMVCLHPSAYSSHPMARCNFSCSSSDMEKARYLMLEHYREKHPNVSVG